MNSLCEPSGLFWRKYSEWPVKKSGCRTCRKTPSMEDRRCDMASWPPCASVWRGECDAQVPVTLHDYQPGILSVIFWHIRRMVKAWRSLEVSTKGRHHRERQVCFGPFCLILHVWSFQVTGVPGSRLERYPLSGNTGQNISTFTPLDGVRTKGRNFTDYTTLSKHSMNVRIMILCVLYFLWLIWWNNSRGSEERGPMTKFLFHRTFYFDCQFQCSPIQSFVYEHHR